MINLLHEQGYSQALLSTTVLQKDGVFLNSAGGPSFGYFDKIEGLKPVFGTFNFMGQDINCKVQLLQANICS